LFVGGSLDSSLLFFNLCPPFPSFVPVYCCIWMLAYASQQRARNLPF
jgi:hypothetical protein